VVDYRLYDVWRLKSDLLIALIIVFICRRRGSASYTELVSDNAYIRIQRLYIRATRDWRLL